MKLMLTSTGIINKSLEEALKKLVGDEIRIAFIPTAAVVDMFGGFNREPKAEVHGVAHITGGGLLGKLGRVLKPSGLGADISNPYLPSDFVRFVQTLGEVPDRDAYSTWNMGQGMVVITPEPDKVMDVADRHEIFSQCVGNVVSSPGIRIENKGAYSKSREELVFE